MLCVGGGSFWRCPSEIQMFIVVCNGDPSTMKPEKRTYAAPAVIRSG